MMFDKFIRLVKFSLVIFLFTCSGFTTLDATNEMVNNVEMPRNNKDALDIIRVNGIVDRVVDEKFVVILFEEMNREMVISQEIFDLQLAPNTWVTVEFVADEVKGIYANCKRTKIEKEKVKDLMKSLQKKKVRHPKGQAQPIF